MARIRLKRRHLDRLKAGEGSEEEDRRSPNPIWNSKWKVMWMLMFIGCVSFMSFQAEHNSFSRLISGLEGTKHLKNLRIAQRVIGSLETDDTGDASKAAAVKATKNRETTLRYDWSNLPVQSPLAKALLEHQTNCSLPLAYFPNRNAAGLGSDLHVYGMALCNAHRNKVRVFTPFPWMYWDEEKCKGVDDGGSSMACYFPKLELQCPGDRDAAAAARNAFASKSTQRLNWQGHEDRLCSSLLGKPEHEGKYKITDLRASVTELQFRSMGDVIIEEAERQLALVFPNGVPDPKTLITVHVRWGDKGAEMALHPISDFIGAVQQMAEHRGLKPHEVNVFLASEDPRAVTQFKNQAPKEWRIFLDQFYIEMLPNRDNSTQTVARTAANLNGRTGLLALGSMLVSMQANSYVLTTGSNWSRLMNELRKAIVSPRCGRCTALIDVQPASDVYEANRFITAAGGKDPNAKRIFDRPPSNPVDGSKWTYVQMRNGHYIRVPKAYQGN